MFNMCTQLEPHNNCIRSWRNTDSLRRGRSKAYFKRMTVMEIKAKNIWINMPNKPGRRTQEDMIELGYIS